MSLIVPALLCVVISSISQIHNVIHAFSSSYVDTQTTSIQTNSTDTNSTQPSSIQPNSTQHNPAQHTPTQPSSTQPNSTQPNSTQHNPAQHTSIQHNPAKHTPTQPSSTQLNSTEHNPAQPNSTPHLKTFDYNSNDVSTLTIEHHHSPRTTLGDHQNQKTTLEDHHLQNPKTTLEDHHLQNPKTTLEDHQNPKTTLEDHQNPKTTLEDHQNPKTTLEEHQNPKTTLEDHQNPKTTLEEHQNPKTTLEDHQNHKTTLEDPQNEDQHRPRHDAFNLTGAIEKGRLFQSEVCSMKCDESWNTTLTEMAKQWRHVACAECGCRTNCSKYGGCCDWRHETLRTDGRSATDGTTSQRHTCFQTDAKTAVYIIASCPGRKDVEDFRRQNSSNDLDDTTTDDVEGNSSATPDDVEGNSSATAEADSGCNSCLSLPNSIRLITSGSTGLTYCNQQCLICNEVRGSGGEVRSVYEIDLPWKETTLCSPPKAPGVSTNASNNTLTNDTLTNNTGGGVNQDVELTCQVTFQRPAGVRQVTCDQRNGGLVVNTCSKSLTESKCNLSPEVAGQLERLCGSYFSPVYHKDVAYQNIFCFLCQGKDPACLRPRSFDKDGNIKSKVNLSMLTNVASGSFYEYDNQATAGKEATNHHVAAGLEHQPEFSPCQDCHLKDENKDKNLLPRCVHGRHLAGNTSRADAYCQVNESQTQPVLYKLNLVWHVLQKDVLLNHELHLRNQHINTSPKVSSNSPAQSSNGESHRDTNLESQDIRKDEHSPKWENLDFQVSCHELIASWDLHDHDNGRDLHEHDNGGDLHDHDNGGDLHEHDNGGDLDDHDKDRDLHEHDNGRDLYERDNGRDLHEHDKDRDLHEHDNGRDLYERDNGRDLHEHDNGRDLHEHDKVRDLHVHDKVRDLHEHDKVRDLHEHNKGRRQRLPFFRSQRPARPVVTETPPLSSDWGQVVHDGRVTPFGGQHSHIDGTTSPTTSSVSHAMKEHIGTALKAMGVGDFFFQIYQLERDSDDLKGGPGAGLSDDLEGGQGADRWLMVDHEGFTADKHPDFGVGAVVYLAFTSGDEREVFERNIVRDFSGLRTISAASGDVTVEQVLSSPEAVNVNMERPVLVNDPVSGDCCHVVAPPQLAGLVGQTLCWGQAGRVIQFSAVTPCHHLTFNLSDFNVSSNNELTRSDLNIILPRSQYARHNQTVSVCVQSLDPPPYDASASLGRAKPSLLVSVESALTIVALTWSLACLLATFVTYVLFPSLRSLPGKNNMILVCWLFTAQLLVILNPLAPRHSAACTALGVALHYSWLSTLTWTCVCAYHMCHVFVVQRGTRTLHKSHRRYLLRYLLVSNVASATVVFYVLTSSALSSGGTSSGYGQTRCYLNSSFLVGVAFLLPLALILLLNCIFFSLTVYSISRIQNVQRCSGRDRKDVHIYIRLSSLTGLCWILALLAEIPGLHPLRCLSVLVNGCQGVTLFVSHVCNRRVTRMWCQLLRTKRSWLKARSREYHQQITVSSSL